MRDTLPSGTPVDVVRVPEAVRGLVLAPDIMGLRPLFDDLAARLAAEHRWTVVAVEPFPGQETLSLQERMATPLDVDRVMADLTAAADVTACEPVAVLGFCRGGMHAYQAAATGRFDRAVAFYGMIRVPPEWNPGRGEPLEELAKPTACPTLAVVGGRDEYTPPDDIGAVRRLPNVEVVVYPEAGHGFVHDPGRPAHRSDDAADAWQRVAEFLAVPSADVDG
ncbi:MAG TPA: dienelactone hydrolase family protein [Acidimicrobiales bacterium]|nr:dienelactone hydrolase family protein [Acidimicrobiales bacterium]